ncbi:hypothetical protein DL96DRAFT_1717412 [Flagelloscypha sp. PMI_526]|nr:hypothetical protein DL96DRAFT_1717412 [Flagelloscypha sp. PMI_526]
MSILKPFPMLPMELYVDILHITAKICTGHDVIGLMLVSRMIHEEDSNVFYQTIVLKKYRSSELFRHTVETKGLATRTKALFVRMADGATPDWGSLWNCFIPGLTKL